MGRCVAPGGDGLGAMPSPMLELMTAARDLKDTARLRSMLGTEDAHATGGEDARAGRDGHVPLLPNRHEAIVAQLLSTLVETQQKDFCNTTVNRMEGLIAVRPLSCWCSRARAARDPAALRSLAQRAPLLLLPVFVQDWFYYDTSEIVAKEENIWGQRNRPASSSAAAPAVAAAAGPAAAAPAGSPTAAVPDAASAGGSPAAAAPDAASAGDPMLAAPLAADAAAGLAAAAPAADAGGPVAAAPADGGTGGPAPATPDAAAAAGGPAPAAPNVADAGGSPAAAAPASPRPDFRYLHGSCKRAAAALLAGIVQFKTAPKQRTAVAPAADADAVPAPPQQQQQQQQQGGEAAVAHAAPAADAAADADADAAPADAAKVHVIRYTVTGNAELDSVHRRIAERLAVLAGALALAFGTALRECGVARDTKGEKLGAARLHELQQLSMYLQQRTEIASREMEEQQAALLAAAEQQHADALRELAAEALEPDGVKKKTPEEEAEEVRQARAAEARAEYLNDPERSKGEHQQRLACTVTKPKQAAGRARASGKKQRRNERRAEQASKRKALGLQPKPTAGIAKLGYEARQVSPDGTRDLQVLQVPTKVFAAVSDAACVVRAVARATPPSLLFVRQLTRTRARLRV